MTITAARPTRLGVGSGALAAVMVGGSVPVSGLLVAYPLLAGQAVRYAIGGLLLLAWAAARRLRITRPAWRDAPALLAVTATGMIGFNAFLIAAQRHADPGLVAAVLGGSPLVIALVVPLMRRVRPSARVTVGAGLVVAGVLALSDGGSWAGPGLALAVLTMLCEASFTLFAVGAIDRLGGFSVALWCTFLAAGGSAVLAVPLDSDARWPTVAETTAMAVVAVLTVVAFCLWYHCVHVLGADRAAVLIGLMPVSGLAVSVALGAQAITITAVAGAVTVAAGCAVGLATRDQSFSARPRPRPAARS